MKSTGVLPAYICSMTKLEHIAYWRETAEDDWLSANDLFATKRYLQCLFLAHLTIEKISKAHWVLDNADDYPRVSTTSCQSGEVPG